MEILSTGGSAKALREAGVAVVEVAAYTAFPEMMDGRVKTLHPKIHGGILARRDLPEHRRAMEEHGIGGIDLVVVNLYPFAATVDSGAGREECVENIDIGGPALIRAAAKNHGFVAVVTDPADYAAVMAEMAAHEGATSLGLRERLARRAFAHTAAYDAAIAGWMNREAKEEFPPLLTLAARHRQALRYGENPHQRAAFYAAIEPGVAARPGIATATQLQGKELSYNNLNDTDAAFELAAEFERPAVAIIKHANPCGVAEADELAAAFRRALACDPLSAYGGIIAVNRPLDAATVEAIGKLFVEVIIAPVVTAEARGLLAAKPNLRVLEAGAMPEAGAAGMSLRSVAGGYLLQGRDDGRAGAADLRTVTKRAPDRGGAGGPAVRLPRGQACEVERHRLCEGGRHRGHRRRADEPRRLGAHRRAEGAGGRRGRGGDPRGDGGRDGAAHAGIGGGLRRLLPLRRRPAGRDRGRRHRGDPARRLAARRRGDRRRGQGGAGDGVHGGEALPALA